MDAEPQRRPEKGTRSKKVKLAALGLMLVPFVLSLYAYDIERNVRVGRKVRESCAAVDQALTLPETRAIATLLFEEDTPAFIADVRGSFHASCAALGEKLTWWHMNIGVSMEMPADAARSERMKRMLRRASERCPRVLARELGPLFRTLSVDAAGERGAIDEICGLVRSTPRFVGGPRMSRPVWDWGDDYVKLAAAAERFRRHQLGTDMPMTIPVDAGAR